MKKFTLFGSLLVGSFFTLQAQSALVQVVHNSFEAGTVDIYVAQGTNSPVKLDDVEFRTATPFLELAAGLETFVYIAPSTSVTLDESIVEYELGALPDGGKFYAVASGDPSRIGNEGGLDLFLLDANVPTEEGVTKVVVFHGISDAPAVDVDARSVGPLAAKLESLNLISDLSFGEFSSFLNLTTVDGYVLDLKVASSGAVVSSYGVPLASSRLGGKNILVLASGSLAADDFGLYVVTAGGGEFLDLPTDAKVQVIHNSADNLLSVVDLYIAYENSEVKLDDVAYKTATGFTTLPADVDIFVKPALSNSTSSAQSVASINVGKLLPGYSYYVIANGIFSPTGYTPATEFTLYPIVARENSYDDDNVDLIVFHGSTDAPEVDVNARGVGYLFSFEYGESAGYLELPAASYTLDINISSTGTPFKSYIADLSSLAGNSAIVLASGFVNPSLNSNGAPFGLFAVLPQGGSFIPLTETVTSLKDVAFGRSSIAPNPASDMVYVNSLSDELIQVTNITGNVVMETSSKEFSVSGLQSGVYFVKVGSKTEKLVVR